MHVYAHICTRVDRRRHVPSKLPLVSSMLISAVTAARGPWLPPKMIAPRFSVPAACFGQRVSPHVCVYVPIRRGICQQIAYFPYTLALFFFWSSGKKPMHEIHTCLHVCLHYLVPRSRQGAVNLRLDPRHIFELATTIPEAGTPSAEPYKMKRNMHIIPWMRVCGGGR
jgi:hypothetical protein